MDPVLREGERLDDLMRGKMRIIQDPALFCFGTDAVLLADFASPKRGERVCDLGTGTGILPLLLCAREPSARVDAVEIQPLLCGIARRNVTLNALDESVRIYEADLRHLSPLLGENRYDCVVCNPPYYTKEDNIGSVRDEVRFARQEVLCTLDDVLAASCRLLKHNARLCIVHPAARAVEMADKMRAYALTPKVVRAIHASPRHAAKLLLWEARKGGNRGLTFAPPLLLRGEDGRETEELKKIYGNDIPT